MISLSLRSLVQSSWLTLLGSALPKHLSNSGFNFDSTGVRFGQYFWIFGGADYCMVKNEWLQGVSFKILGF